MTNKYILMRNVKIDSIYRYSNAGNRNGDSHYINFKDSGKTISLLLKEKTNRQKQIFTDIFNDRIRTVDLVKKLKSKTLLRGIMYYTYDERFVCDSNDQCDFTEAYKRNQIKYLILGFFIFIGITYCTYRIYNSRIIKSLKGEKLNFSLANLIIKSKQSNF
ncbi:hypothetical protein [Flavobacterium undicola]|uniref:hypothetical protein n=1 Tax=Flavobacterium undicola TaxID=1932779 RepID=UPI00137717D3|nr:hypothetical protein [Flavobacterium undicola]MBA0882661.1 hypothetical protein [Flavobacterium undicola]